MGFLNVLNKSEKVEETKTETVAINPEDVPVKDFFESSLDDYKEFEDHAWKKGEGYKLPNFPMVEEKLEGLDEGLYLIAAESNMGKSAAMLNMIYDACTYAPNKLFGIYYSLDDGKNDIIPRVIAADKMIPISVAAKPQRFKNMIERGEENSAQYQDWLIKRQQGLDALKAVNHMFKIEDSNRIKTAEDMYDNMRQLQIYIKAIDPEANIIVAIDAVDDVRFANKYFSNTTDRHAEIAKTIKDWSTQLHIPIFGSRHLSKLKQNRRPILDDLKDSNEYVYEASVVWLLYNDVSKNKQGANIFSTEEGVEGKQPIIEFDWAKNKKSAFKGRTYSYFTPEYSKMTECSKDVMNRFDALIYSN
jgi:replicative DNA helicase